MIEAKPGARFTVRDEPINRSNDFWAPLIGHSGTVVAVSGDGLLDVAVGDSDSRVAEGVLPERFCIFDVAAAGLFKPRPWWKRLLFWRQPVVKQRR